MRIPGTTRRQQSNVAAADVVAEVGVEEQGGAADVATVVVWTPIDLTFSDHGPVIVSLVCVFF